MGNIDSTRIEDRLRAALHRRAGEVTMSPATRVRLERRLRRQPWRLAAITTAVLAAVVVLGVVAMPWLGNLHDGQPATQGARQRYEANGIVRQADGRGPELCLGLVLTSWVPQCSGTPVTNWDWDRVDGEQHQAGVTWGTYRVVGTYDGTSFTVAEAAPSQPTPPTQREPFRPGCPEPAGGWPQPDPARATEADKQAALGRARSQPDFAGAWVSYVDPASTKFVLTVAFTGDLDRHEQQLRERWGGRLCVTRKARAFRELSRVQRELQPSGAATKELGLQVLWGWLDEYANAVNLMVVVGADRAQTALDQRYGAGVVRVDAALKPVR